eukprot:2190628-Rhodomonas_salina.1
MGSSVDDNAVQREIDALQRQIDLATTPKRPDGAKPRAVSAFRKPQGNLDFLGPTLPSPRESEPLNPLSAHELQTPAETPKGTSASEGKLSSGKPRVRAGLKLPSPDQDVGAAESGSRGHSGPIAEDDHKQGQQEAFGQQQRGRQEATVSAVPEDDALKYEQDGVLEPSFFGGILEHGEEVDALAFSQDVESLEFEKDMHTWQLAHISEENHKLRKANQLL